MLKKKKDSVDYTNVNFRRHWIWHFWDLKTCSKPGYSLQNNHWPSSQFNQTRVKIHENILPLSKTQHDLSLSSFLLRLQCDATVTMEDGNAFFFHMTQLTLTGNRLGHFKNPSQWASDAIHLFSLIGLSETALRACITTLASEEKPCYHLSLVCFLQSGIDSLNKQEELCTCRYTCTHSPHTGASKQTTSCCQQYTHIT